MLTVQRDRVLDVLDDGECRALLATATIGRIAFTEGALPAIQPVSFTVDRGEIVVPTQQGSTVAAASRGTVVAFEVDDYDVLGRTGWHVTVVGTSRLISDPAGIGELDLLGTRAWAPAGERCYVAIGIRLVHGRRLRVAAGAPAAVRALVPEPTPVPD
ncbi:pyridoxamine 5'-phosphate oxidase family protein [uncultured Modestobacter sp.]|uniref:pyridoxamine 5'-phosphate oxidase family protein n=1 Tax=uncultured Modestobacter sp. TaxID=380048 RepID=UPI00260457D6|nr:pyridoxamine 5'-phosphate oxidase family protein [uncultured Modestobacter sp.]